MERRSISISGKVSLLMVVFIMGVAVRAERVNKSTSIWSTTEDEGYLSGSDAPESDDDLWDDEENHLHFNGGFSSLDGMLQWSIGHSDPAKLEEAALGIQNLSPEELEQRQLEIKELMEKLKTPSDAKLMQIAIDDLNNSSLPFEDHHRALQELLILVEPIDNANDLHKLGGLTAVIRELNNTNAELRTISAWIIGKASQNNHFVKNQTLKLGTLAMLIKMVYSDFVEEATKALYAVSALVRNNMEGQELFYLEAGDMMLQNIISNSSTDIRLRRKSVSLLADLVECQLDNWNNTELPFFSNRSLLKSVVDLLASQDLDLQEKALHAVKNLLLLRSVDALVLKDFCQLDAVLGRLREQLQPLILGDTYKDYALDLENLRREVELIFLGKLEQQDCKKCGHGQPKNAEPKRMPTDSTTSSKRKNPEAHLTKSMILQVI